MMPQGKYRIMSFKEFIPDKLRFAILLLGAGIFQFSNSTYLANINETVGGKALTDEDIKMIFYASMIGLTMVFPLLFRFKFRFPSRTILLVCSSVVILGNIAALYCNNVFVLILISFILGFFRMMGTFECFSSINLIITPTRDFSVFYPFIYMIILGSIQFSGLINADISYALNWKYMYVLIVSLQLSFMIIIFTLMRPILLMKRIPLYQIDWLGMLLWTVVIFLVSFIAEYGERLDWFYSRYIRIATGSCIILLICAIQRMTGLKRPFIMPEAFAYRNVIKSLVLLFLLELFISTNTVIMNAYLGGFLEYNMEHINSLNWIVVVGIVLGTALSYYWLHVRGGGYKVAFFGGFACLVLYHFILYFTFQHSVAKADLYIPYFLYGIGYIVLYIAIALYAADRVPFPHFFATLCILGFVRSGIGMPVADSITHNLWHHIQEKNVMLLSSGMDTVDPTTNLLYGYVFNGAIGAGRSIEQAQSMATSALYGNVYKQAMLLSWKDIYGWYTLFGALVLLGILFTHYRKPSFPKIRKLKNIWRYARGKVYSNG